MLKTLILNEKKNENRPLVSVSITCKNYGKYIEKSLESVLEQSYNNIEIFVIDDNSIDESKKILAKVGQNVVAGESLIAKS